VNCWFGRTARVVFVVGAWATPSSAQTVEPRNVETIVFDVECPELAAEAAAEVEARSRVEAGLRNLGALDVWMRCQAGSLDVRVQTRPGPGRSSSSEGQRGSRPLEVALVDLFVQALDDLEPVSASPLGATSSSSGSSSDVVEPTPPGQEQAPVDAPTVTVLEPEKPRSVQGREAQRRRPSPALKRPFARLAWDVFGVAETLGTEAPLALGGGTALLLAPSPVFRVGPVGRLARGVGVQNLSLTTLHAGLMGEYSPLPWLALGLGPIVSVHFVQAESPVRARGVHSLFGGAASVHFLIGTPKFAFRAGATLSVLSSDRVVRIREVEQLHLPPVSVELQLGGRLGFFLE
jgi:hypothetical protein